MTSIKNQAKTPRPYSKDRTNEMPSFSPPVTLYQAYFVTLGADDNIEHCVKNLPRQQNHAGIEFGESQYSLFLTSKIINLFQTVPACTAS